MSLLLSRHFGVFGSKGRSAHEVVPGTVLADLDDIGDVLTWTPGQSG